MKGIGAWWGNRDKRSTEARQSGLTAGQNAGGGFANAGNHGLGGGYTGKLSDIRGGETGRFKDIIGDLSFRAQQNLDLNWLRKSSSRPGIYVGCEACHNCSKTSSSMTSVNVLFLIKGPSVLPISETQPQRIPLGRANLPSIQGCSS